MVLSITALACIWYNYCRTSGLTVVEETVFLLSRLDLFLNMTSSTYDIIRNATRKGYRIIQFMVQQVWFFTKRLNWM